MTDEADEKPSASNSNSSKFGILIMLFATVGLVACLARVGTESFQKVWHGFNRDMIAPCIVHDLGCASGPQGLRVKASLINKGLAFMSTGENHITVDGTTIDAARAAISRLTPGTIKNEKPAVQLVSTPIDLASFKTDERLRQILALPQVESAAKDLPFIEKFVDYEAELQNGATSRPCHIYELTLAQTRDGGYLRDFVIEFDGVPGAGELMVLSSADRRTPDAE
jgi:hypothetical protein